MAETYPEFLNIQEPSPAEVREITQNKGPERIKLEKEIDELLAVVETRIGPEKKEIFDGYVKVIKFFEAELYNRHVDKSFHHPRHSFILAQRVVADLRVIQQYKPEEVSEEDILLGIAEAMAHDAVIKELPPFGVAGTELTDEIVQNMKVEQMISRNRGAAEGDIPGGREGNEAKSADELIAEMKNNPVLAKLLEETEGLEDRIRKDIATTYPAANLVKHESGKVLYVDFTQPHNNADVSWTGFALAKGDLQGAYRNDAPKDQIIREGNAEWVELHRKVSYIFKKDLEEARARGRDLKEILFTTFLPEDREAIVKSIILWKKQQPHFVEFQKGQFDEHLKEHLLLKQPFFDQAGKKFTIADKYREAYKHKEGGVEVDNFDAAQKLAQDEYEKLVEVFDAELDASGTEVVKIKPVTSEDFYELLKYMGFLNRAA